MCRVCVTTEKFGLVNGFIDHSYTRLGTTSNYSATANPHNSKINTAPAKPFPAFRDFTSRYLATASNSGDSSASRTQVSSSQPPLQNSTELIAPAFLYIIFQHGPHRKHRSSTVAFVSVAAGTFYRVFAQKRVA
jgi:hypothetical protein